MVAPQVLQTMLLLALVGLRGAVDPPVLVMEGDGDGERDPKTELATIGTGDDRCKAIAVNELNGQSCQMTETDKEELGKLSVRLLNCQRALEGRSVFPCTPEMSLQQCTRPMDETIWGSYMQVQRAALEVCLQFQQSQWQRETADTVRALTETAMAARGTMEELRDGQAALGNMNREVLDAANQHHQAQMEQHGELKDTAAGMLTDVHALASQQTALIERNDALVASSTLARDQFTAFHDDMSGKMDDYKTRLQTIYAAIEAVLSVEQSILQQFFDTAAAVFYLAAVSLCYLLTTATETRSCRLMLFLLLAVNLFVERAVSRHGIATAADPGPMADEDHGRATADQIWFVRKLFTSVCCLLLSGAAWLYEDVGVANKVALSTLLAQNSQILDALARHGIGVPAAAAAAPTGDGGGGFGNAATTGMGQTMGCQGQINAAAGGAGPGAVEGFAGGRQFRLVQRGQCVVMEAAGDPI